MKEFTIDENNLNKRLDLFLTNVTDYSRSFIQQLITERKISVNDKYNVSKNLKLKINDSIKIDDIKNKEIEISPENIPINVVYEDDDLLVVNKDKGIVVHPAPGNYNHTLVNAILYHCKGNLSGINGIIRPGIVHRIDKDTSGLLVIAKNDNAHIFLSNQISSHTFERKYNAIVLGRLNVESGIIDKPIGRSKTDRKKMAVVSDGKKAKTHFKVIKSYKNFSLVEFQLETGRTHQIRVHMASIGHPIFGDTCYGSCQSKYEKIYLKKYSGQCLHAKTISFIHPRTNQLIRFDSELPDYFNFILELLEDNKENI